MKISVIIPVFNEQQTIKNCLDSLLNQTLPSEIIAVDDGSTDNTLNVLKNYQKKPKIKLLTQLHQGPAIARNKAAKSSKNDILVFADADMTFAPDYLEKLTKPIKAKKAIGTYTTNERVSNWHNIWARCWNIQEGWAPKRRFPNNPPKWGTDYRAILKSEFEKVNGFSNIGYTDTWTLFQKLKKRPLRTQATCYHKNPESLKQVFRQAKWVAKRPYKLATLGTFIALVRTSLPISLVVGLFKSLINLQPAFFPFKLVYDFGRFLGILELLFTNNKSK